MNTPPFVETTPNRPETARLQNKSSWLAMVWSRWHADGRPFPGHGIDSENPIQKARGRFPGAGFEILAMIRSCR
jgi:hypothetical protein